uniref:rhomboid family intramembrane serine protease n=1 Tax=Acetatifactor sp. TaxID=1872090 RepID=UPI004056371B
MRKWKNVPIVSVTLVVVNVIIFIICTFTGDMLYNMGEMGVRGVLAQREYGRIFSAMFLHDDFNHIFNNMLILFLMGTMIEKEIGHKWFLCVYLLSGIGGNLISLFYKVLTYERACSIGASGAVFGLDGVLLALVLFAGHRMQDITPTRVLFMVAYSLYSGFTGQNIDNAAHVGGLMIGFLLGIVICMIDKLKGSERCNIEY